MSRMQSPPMRILPNNQSPSPVKGLDQKRHRMRRGKALVLPDPTGTRWMARLGSEYKPVNVFDICRMEKQETIWLEIPGRHTGMRRSCELLDKYLSWWKKWLLFSKYQSINSIASFLSSSKTRPHAFRNFHVLSPASTPFTLHPTNMRVETFLTYS